MRIILFLLTNAAVLLLISIIFRMLGIDNALYQNGVDINLDQLLLVSAVIGMSGSFISLLTSKWMAKSSMGVYVIGQPANSTEQWLLECVHNLARGAGIGMPEVGIFDSPSPNAFATGFNKNNALVAVSTGLLQNMNAEEVEAVLGHEITHVANGDMVTLGLLQGVVNTFVIFFARLAGFFVDRVLLRNERGFGIGYFITQMVAQLVFSIFASMIVMWFSRYREFHADAGGAHLAGRQKMIDALRALQRTHDTESLPSGMAAFGISGGGGFSRLFMSHPPLEERIAALQKLN